MDLVRYKSKATNLNESVFGHKPVVSHQPCWWLVTALHIALEYPVMLVSNVSTAAVMLLHQSVYLNQAT